MEMAEFQRGVFVLINTFAVAPGRQQELLDMLADVTDKVMRDVPGFISANFHKSLDGKRVVNYAQWQTKADFEAMTKNPLAQEHMAKAGKITESFEPVGYELASTHSAE